jgi:hypothetical protein
MPPYLDLDHRSQSLPSVTAAIDLANSNSSSSGNLTKKQSLPRAGLLPIKRSNSFSASAPVVSTEADSAVLADSLKSFHDLFGVFHHILLGGELKQTHCCCLPH